MMLILNLSIGSSPIATHQNPLPGTLRPESRHCLTLTLPACRWLLYFQAPGTIIDTPTC